MFGVKGEMRKKQGGATRSKMQAVGFKTNDSGWTSRDKPLQIIRISVNFGVAMPFTASTPADHLAGAKPDQEHDLRRAPLLVLDISGVSAFARPRNSSPSKAQAEKTRRPNFRVLPPIPRSSANHQNPRTPPGPPRFQRGPARTRRSPPDG